MLIEPTESAYMITSGIFLPVCKGA